MAPFSAANRRRDHLVIERFSTCKHLDHHHHRHPPISTPHQALPRHPGRTHPPDWPPYPDLTCALARTASTAPGHQSVPSAPAYLPSLRAGLTVGTGWFEVFFVPKRHSTQEVLAYADAWARHLDQGRPIPTDIAHALDPRVISCIQQQIPFPRELRELVYDITPLGPYAKYRWRLGKHTYTISLGLLSDYPPFPFVLDGF